jgi:hypothetical protein
LCKREKKEKITVDDKPLINDHHAPHQEDEGEEALLMKWWNNIFFHRKVSYAPFKKHGRLPRVNM